jgi:beta-N-acetylhexosaminidase
MVGHVAVTAIDPDRAASYSKRVIDGLIRKEWGYQGLVITDDLVMGPIYEHGVRTAVTEARSMRARICCWSPMTASNSTASSIAR